MPTKSWNKNLRKAHKAKNDEFYTQISDIEKELGNYREYFRDKVIFCNCDDPEDSNFWRYFKENFEFLWLKKLISTHFETEKQSYRLEISRDINHDGKINKKDEEKIKLKQNGDFRSSECIEILKEADIVVTNPPFSLFREYIAQLFEYNKKFIIVGNQNAIGYKEIFKIIKENKLWLGYGFNGGAAHFINRHYEDYATAGGHKEGMIRVSGVVWFTNIETRKRHEDLILYKTYRGNEHEYPKYENYDAINVNKTKDIPIDYDGLIGVPITFMDKYNPEQFEIIGLGISSSGTEIGVRPYTEEHKKYRKEIQKRGAVDGDLYMIKDGVVDVPYSRIIIRNKKL